MSMFIKSAAYASVLLGQLVSVEAYSAVYMSEEKAVAVLFPGLQFEKSIFPLSADDRKKIKDLSGETQRGENATVWRAKTGEWVFVDRVLGKHEFITYAVGIDRDGKVSGIEILEYRESYGHEVRGEKWRAQFIGKDKTAPLKLDEDIKNISGATLSSAHISAGVRRVLQTYELLKPRA
jgi:Na+-translocating ferredoxin:NAD+ oxidoreductase RnfG subunit